MNGPDGITLSVLKSAKRCDHDGFITNGYKLGVRHHSGCPRAPSLTTSVYAVVPEPICYS